MQHIRLEIHKNARIAILTLQRGGNGAKGNSFNEEMFLEFKGVLKDLRKTTRKILGLAITATGDHFCLGRDLHFNGGKSAHTEKEIQLAAYDALIALSRLNMLKLACVQNTAAGFGAALALTCDYRMMREDAQLSFVETSMGFPPLAASALLTALPTGLALEIICQPNHTLSAQQCIDLGLANEIRTWRDGHPPIYDHPHFQSNSHTPECIAAILQLRRRLQCGGIEPLVEAREICVKKLFGDPKVIDIITRRIRLKAQQL